MDAVDCGGGVLLCPARGRPAAGLYPVDADGGTGAKGTTFGITAPVAGVNVGAIFTKNNDANALASELFVNKEIFKSTYAYFDYGNVDKFPVGAATTSSKNTYALGVIYTF